MPQAMNIDNSPYMLRWRFDFTNRASVFGMWNSPVNTAWDKNREGMTRASIEAKSVKTCLTSTVAECDGHDFRNFQWIAIARVNPNFRGSVSPPPEHVGLKILTTTEEVAVLITGQCARRQLSPEEKGINFATFGR